MSETSEEAARILYSIMNNMHTTAAAKDVPVRDLPDLDTMDTLNLAYGGINGRFKDLGMVLPHLKVLTELNLSGNGFDVDGFALFAPAIATLKGLTNLNLSHNSIRDTRGATHLAEVLSSLTALEKLQIQHTALGDEGVERLKANLSRLVALEELNLCGNEISEVGARDLAEALPSLTSLTELDLHDNRLNDAGVQALAPVLPASLVSMDLSENGIGNAGALAVAAAFPRLPAFRSLTIMGNRIHDEATKQKIREALGIFVGNVFF